MEQGVRAVSYRSEFLEYRTRKKNYNNIFYLLLNPYINLVVNAGFDQYLHVSQVLNTDATAVFASKLVHIYWSSVECLQSHNQTCC